MCHAEKNARITLAKTAKIQNEWGKIPGVKSN